MRQLTSLDAQFIAIEDGRTHGHVSGLGIYDPSTAPGGELTLAGITEMIRSRLHLLPPFTWKLVHVPFDLDYPYWVEDPSFDLEFHVRELALPEPGDEQMLAEQVARLLSRPLDRARPLWELYLIHGLEGGRKGVLTKFHHAAIDGASGAEIFGILLDFAPEGREVPPASAAASRPESPSQVSMLARGLAGMPRQRVEALRGLPRALPNLDLLPTMRSIPGVETVAGVSRRVARALPSGDGGVLQGRRLQAPRTSFNGRISPHRRDAFVRTSLDEVKQIKSAYGVTVNDVVVSICAGALRTWMADRGELPDEPLVAMIPMSVRTREQIGTFGNRVSTMLTTIPTHLAGAEERLLYAHERLIAAKERHKAVPATMLQDANNVIPPALFARAARVTSALNTGGLVRTPVNVVISNVPGSPIPMYIAGARQEAMYPLSAIMDGCALNITVMSYCGGLDFGVVLDREVADEAWPLADALARAQGQLLALVAPPARRGRAAKARPAA